MNKVPWAVKEGAIKIGATVIPCAVLDDGRRVLTQQGVLIALGRSRTAKGGEGASVDEKPAFMRAANLKSFISEDLDLSTKPIVYKPLSGGHNGLAYGCDCTAFPEILNVYVQALKAGKIRPNQQHVADTARRLHAAIPKIGMIALVDEATGNQEDRRHDELQMILEAYVLPEHRPYIKEIPREFTRELYRVWGWDTTSTRGPRFAGKLTRKLLYGNFPPPVLPKLDEVNPTNEKYQRKRKHFSFLTEAYGLTQMRSTIAGVMALLRASPNKRVFTMLYERSFGKQGKLFEEDIDSEF